MPGVEGDCAFGVSQHSIDGQYPKGYFDGKKVSFRHIRGKSSMPQALVLPAKRSGLPRVCAVVLCGPQGPAWRRPLRGARQRGRAADCCYISKAEVDDSLMQVNHEIPSKRIKWSGRLQASQSTENQTRRIPTICFKPPSHTV